MKKSAKILLLILSVWPFIYGIVFFVIMLETFSSMPMNGRPDMGAFEHMFRYIIPLHLLTMLDVLGLTIFYMVNVFRNDRVIKDKKALWAVVLFMGNVVAFPVYWYYYIWPEKDAPLDAAHDRKAFYHTDPAHWTGAQPTSEGRREYAPPPEPPDWR